MSQRDHDDEEALRLALRAAAESVHPADDGLERIRARLSAPRPWLVAWVLAASAEVAGRALSGLLSARAWLRAVPAAVGERRRTARPAARPGAPRPPLAWLRPAIVMALAVLVAAAGALSLTPLPRQAVSQAAAFFRSLGGTGPAGGGSGPGTSGHAAGQSPGPAGVAGTGRDKRKHRHAAPGPAQCVAAIFASGAICPTTAASATPKASASPTPCPSVSASPTRTPAGSPSSSPASSPSPSPDASPTSSRTPSPSPSASRTPCPSQTGSPGPSVSPGPTSSVSLGPTGSQSPSPSPTLTPSPTASPSDAGSPGTASPGTASPGPASAAPASAAPASAAPASAGPASAAPASAHPGSRGAAGRQEAGREKDSDALPGLWAAREVIAVRVLVAIAERTARGHRGDHRSLPLCPAGQAANGSATAGDPDGNDRSFPACPTGPAEAAAAATRRPGLPRWPGRGDWPGRGAWPGWGDWPGWGGWQAAPDGAAAMLDWSLIPRG
ncbi:MAG: hypothetical protein ACLQER_02575 [Streptosporangiaceae bacterium]